MNEKTAGLVNSELFGTVDLDLIQRLQDAAKTVVLEKDEPLFIQGDPADAIYIIEEGIIEVSILSEQGKKLTLNVMRKSDVFGEIAALDGGARTATASALEKTTLRKIHRQEIMNIIADRGDLAVDLIQLLCKRIRWISQQVEDLALTNIEQRLARKLVILSRKFSDQTGLLQISQSELADFLGATRESVNKILQEWVARDVVVLTRGAVKINDHDTLENIAAME